MAPHGDAAPLTTLRGASVEVDLRRLRRAALIALVATLTTIGIVLLAAVIKHDRQVSALRSSGRSVDLRVSGCVGQAAGSGSDLAAYRCRGTFDLGASRYVAAITTTSPAAPGALLRIVADRADPALVSTPASLAAGGTGWRGLVLPALLLTASLGVGGAAALRRRRSQDEERGGA